MDAMQRIALAIMQGRGANPASLNPPLAPAPPPINPMDFGVPQQDVAPAPATPEQTMPPTTVAALPLPAPAANPAQAPVGMPSELHPSLAVPATQASPGMSQVPQTMAQLDEWRKLMDAMQFARQGV